MLTNTPRNTDVKPGNFKSPGNKLYTDLIKKNKKAFVFANMHKDNKTKHVIVQSIYECIRKQSPPGRFLMKNADGSFSIKSEENAIRKIKKALSENKNTIESHFRFRGQAPAQTAKTARTPTKSARMDLLQAILEKEIKSARSATSKTTTKNTSKTKTKHLR